MIDRKNKNFRAGAIITGIMLLIIIIGAFWTPYDPNAMNGATKWAKPSLACQASLIGGFYNSTNAVNIARRRRI